MHKPVGHLGISAADLKLFGPHDLGLRKFAAPTVIVAIKPPVAGDLAVKTQARAVADIAGRNNVAGTNRAGQAMSITVITSAGALRYGNRKRPADGAGADK